MWYEEVGVEVRVVWVPKQLTFPMESKKLTLSHGKKKKKANLEHLLFLGSNNDSKYFSQRLHHTQESSIPKSFQPIYLQTVTKHTLAVDKSN